MTVREFGHALSIGAAVAFLAACGGAQTPVGIPGATTQTSAIARAPSSVHRILPASSTYTVLYRFTGHPDGAYPQGALLDVHGTLYGTTVAGGVAECTEDLGCGTVYTITTAGAEKVLFSFNKSDGAYPYAGLTEVNGTLYGTTTHGGTGDRCGGNCGTVYSITTTGAENVLFDFAGYPSGAFPYAPLKAVKGTLYGTTQAGGSRHGPGTVYSITPTGVFKRLLAFKTTDGGYPHAGLIDVNGTLYGTTARGGGSCNCGTVYSITTTGTEKVVYEFQGGANGAYPSTSLINVNGTLYGTAQAGSGSFCCGIVYSVSTSGKFKVLYTFAGGSDGQSPQSALIDVNGTLYGTTYAGGGSSACTNGCGTVYSVTTAGVETVLHRFAGGSDGAAPEAPLLYLHGMLYGTTSNGGGSGCRKIHCGTFFALSP